MSHVARTLKADGIARNGEVVTCHIVFFVTVECFIVTYITNGQSVFKFIVLTCIIGFLATGRGLTLKLVIGVGIFHWHDMVVNEHQVTQFLRILLHVLLGCIDFGLSGSHEIVGIVAHVVIIDGNEHSV